MAYSAFALKEAARLKKTKFVLEQRVNRYTDPLSSQEVERNDHDVPSEHKEDRAKSTAQEEICI